MNLRFRLTRLIFRVFPSEAAETITSRLHLIDTQPPKLMTVNKWGLRLVVLVLAVESFLLMMWVVLYLLGGVEWTS